jgi:hypothetical protein
VNRSLDVLVRKVGAEVISDEDAKAERARLYDQRDRLRESLDKVNDLLADVPTADEVRRYIERTTGPDGRPIVRLVGTDGKAQLLGGNDYPTVAYYAEHASREDRVKLIEAAFAAGDRLADGKPAGVYMHASTGVTPRQYSYQLRGRLLPDSVRLLPRKHCLPASR